jgi:hypothetical protein
MSEHILTVWVIYYGATNHPRGVWVVRPQDVTNGSTIQPHAIFHECRSLEEARAKVPEGLCRMNRHPSDDPVIVETWI